MDFDDVDDPFQAAAKPTTRFAPKSSKFQPKSKAGVKVNPPPPKAEPPAAVKKEEDADSVPAVAKMDVDEERKAPVKNGEHAELKEEKMEESDAPETSNDVAVEKEEEEVDHVVAEYDVYFIPRDSQTQLYVFQYPLRPSWRPYEMEERCTEVRMKPKSGELEVDLSIDTGSDNYNANFTNAINKQTLSSSCRLPQATTYAIGVLSGKKLYVNPIQAIVQLRPSMEYLDSGGSKKKHNAENANEEGPNDDLARPSRKQSKQMDPEVVESWISLKYHSSATELAERYMTNMVTEQKDPLQFLMNPSDYLDSMCPGAVINKTKSTGPSRRYLLSLPLEERLKTLLIEGPPIQRFTAIKYLAPDDPVEDVLEVLQNHADLVQGLWVPKTSLRHPHLSGVELLARHYTLILFSQNPVIKDKDLNVLGSSKSTARKALPEIAVERLYCQDWKFKEPTDVSFLKLYPKVVEYQQSRWQLRDQQIQQHFAARKAGLKLKKSTRPEPSTGSDEGAVRANVAPSVRNSMSKETREALPKVLKKLFQTHKVCSFQTICQGLRDLAVNMSSHPKADARAAVAAAKGVDAPPEELQAAISEVAVNIHGVYVLRSSSEHAEIAPLRDLVIDLFLGSTPNAKLKKGEFIEAAKIKLQKEPTNIEFQKVINEFCEAKGGAWMLKSGDGVPKGS